MDRPTGLPMVLILECRSHLDIGDLPNLLAAELGVMTVRLERAIRSLDGVARVHVNRWGDGSAHLHMWFLARPYGRLQLRGTFLSLWDDILPVIPEEQWLENLALVAAWLAEFGGRAIAEPPHIHWQSPSTFSNEPTAAAETTVAPGVWRPANLEDTQSPPPGHTSDGGGAFSESETRDLSATADRAAVMADEAISAAGLDTPKPEQDGAATATDSETSTPARDQAATTADSETRTPELDRAASTSGLETQAPENEGAASAVGRATPAQEQDEVADVDTQAAGHDGADSSAGLETPTPEHDASPPATDQAPDVRGSATEGRAADEPIVVTAGAEEPTGAENDDETTEESGSPSATAATAADAEKIPEQSRTPEKDEANGSPTTESADTASATTRRTTASVPDVH